MAETFPFLRDTESIDFTLDTLIEAWATISCVNALSSYDYYDPQAQNYADNHNPSIFIKHNYSV
jgi:hypothetical protein